MTPIESDQQKAEAEIHNVMYDKNHVMYERFHRSDPEVVRYVNLLWEKTAAPEPQPPSAPQVSIPDQIAAAQSKVDAEKRSVDNLIAEVGPIEAAARQKAADETVCQLCDPSSQADQEFVNVLLQLRPDPEFRDRASSIRPKLNARTVDISRMSTAELRARVDANLQELFGGKDTPLMRKFEKYFPTEASQSRLFYWLASKNFR
jgi:hypothetical protein